LMESNPHHLEGDVFTHTMMVFNTAVNWNMDFKVQIAALLHDIAKPYTREVFFKDGINKVSFRNHEALGFYRSLDILRKVYSDILSDRDIMNIATVIAHHTSLFQYRAKTNKYSSLAEYVGKAFGHYDYDAIGILNALSYCDSDGRISKDGMVHYMSSIDGYEDHISEQYVSDKKLTLLVGPPNAGKNYYLDNTFFDGDTVSISRDDIVMELGEGTYNECWKSVDHSEVDRILNKRFNTSLKEGKNIIVNMTNMSKKSRRRWINPARQKDYMVEAVVFYTSYDTIMERNNNREGKYIPTDVIVNMMKSFCYPTYEEVDNIVEVI